VKGVEGLSAEKALKCCIEIFVLRTKELPDMSERVLAGTGASSELANGLDERVKVLVGETGASGLEEGLSLVGCHDSRAERVRRAGGEMVMVRRGGESREAHGRIGRGGRSVGHGGGGGVLFPRRKGA